MNLLNERSVLGTTRVFRSLNVSLLNKLTNKQKKTYRFAAFKDLQYRNQTACEISIFWVIQKNRFICMNQNPTTAITHPAISQATLTPAV